MAATQFAKEVQPPMRYKSASSCEEDETAMNGSMISLPCIPLMERPTL